MRHETSQSTLDSVLACSELASAIRSDGREWNEKSSQKMVERELKRNPPSEYSVGEKVIIRASVPVAPGSKQRGKRLTEVVVTGTVAALDGDHMYNVCISYISIFIA